MAELDRIRVATVLAADAYLQIGSRGPAFLDAHLHQDAGAVGVDGLERVAGDDVMLHVKRMKLP